MSSASSNTSLTEALALPKIISDTYIEGIYRRPNISQVTEFVLNLSCLIRNYTKMTDVLAFSNAPIEQYRDEKLFIL